MAQVAIPGPVLVTVIGLAEILNTSPRSIYRYRSEGKLPTGLRLGQQLRWRRGEVEAWIEAGMPPRRDWEKMKTRTKEASSRAI